MTSIEKINTIDWSESFIEDLNLNFKIPNPMQPFAVCSLVVFNSADGVRYTFILTCVLTIDLCDSLNSLSGIKVTKKKGDGNLFLEIYDYASSNKSIPSLTIKCRKVELF